MFPLYFVGGAFGVGKSTLCEALSPLLPAEHLKASDLVQYTCNPTDATGKATGKILSNQERLVAELEIRRAALGHVLLDGHFCLLDDRYNVVQLPVAVFQRIEPSALVLVESDLVEVVDRIRRRAQQEIDPALVKHLLQAEREHAHTISEALRVPVMAVNASTDIQDIMTFLRASSKGR